MNHALTFKKIKLFFTTLAMILSVASLFEACITSKAKKANPSENEYSQNDARTVKAVEKRIQSQPDYNPAPHFVPLTATYSSFLTFFDMTNFNKFKIVPYQRDSNDVVRLYCYALSSDYDVNKMGNAFYISSDHSGEIPRTLYHPVIYDDLVLSKDDMKDIFNSAPVSVIYLTLVPVRANENGKIYNTYQVFKNGHNTQIHFKLAPKNYN